MHTKRRCKNYFKYLLRNLFDTKYYIVHNKLPHFIRTEGSLYVKYYCNLLCEHIRET